MPTQKDLLALIRRRVAPQEIIARLALRPSRLRRMLSGKRLRTALTMEQRLGLLTASQQIAASTVAAGERLIELLDCDSSETARKVALAIMHETLTPPRRSAPGASSPADLLAEQSAENTPAAHRVAAAKLGRGKES